MDVKCCNSDKEVTKPMPTNVFADRNIGITFFLFTYLQTIPERNETEVVEDLSNFQSY